MFDIKDYHKLYRVTRNYHDSLSMYACNNDLDILKGICDKIYNSIRKNDVIHKDDYDEFKKYVSKLVNIADAIKDLDAVLKEIDLEYARIY